MICLQILYSHTYIILNQKLSMKGPSELDPKSPQNSYALVFPDSLAYLLPSLFDEIVKLIFPVYAAKYLLGFEVREDLHKYLE